MNVKHKFITLGRLVTLDSFSAIFHKGDNFCDFLFAFRNNNLFLKMVYSKRKEFSLKGSKLFPFILESFPEGNRISLDGVPYPECVSISLN